MRGSLTSPRVAGVKVGDVITIGNRPCLVTGKPDATTLNIKYISQLRFWFWLVGGWISAYIKRVIKR